VPVGARRRHQRGDAVDQLQWREVQLVGLGTAPVGVMVAAGVGSFAVRTSLAHCCTW
jgi:hypothetical protein